MTDLSQYHEDRIRWPYKFMRKRHDVVERLLADDPNSIDAAALTMIGLSTLASYRFPGDSSSHGKLRELLETHCGSFVNRYSIPELLRRSDKLGIGRTACEAVRRRFPIEGCGIVRRFEEDPKVASFRAWLAESGIAIGVRTLEKVDYAGLINANYRHSIVHEMRIGRSREAWAQDDDDDIFYANVQHWRLVDDVERIMAEEDQYPEREMYFAVRHAFLARLFLEAILDVEKYAVPNRENIFPDHED